MKRLKYALFLLLSAVISAAPFMVLSEGEGNMNGGGDAVNTSGTKANTWVPGYDGVRVTVVNADTQQPVTSSIDYTNKNLTIDYHFGKVDKISYRNGAPLIPKRSTYTCINLDIPMPIIITSNSKPANIEETKRYFCSEYFIQTLATDTGMSYDDLISDNYRIMLEPIAYITLNSEQVALTAHEAAMYDNILNGGFREKLITIPFRNLPLAMFLEYPDLGFPVYTGSKTVIVPNDLIIAQLGVGIVRFSEELPPFEPPQTDYKYVYRTDTDVITPVTLYAGSEINPESPASVTFNIKGGSYTVNNIVIPEGGSQLVWVKWHTPSYEQDITVTVSASKGGLSQSTIAVKIIDLSGNEPPDPKARDTKGDWTPAPLPVNPQSTSASWTVWDAEWFEYWVWEPDWEQCWHTDWIDDGEGGGEYDEWYHWVDNGEWVDLGWWDFSIDTYSASLSASMSIMPDDKVPTAVGKKMKSGYGVKTTVSASASSSAPSSHYTGAQNTITYFPEFRYEGVEFTDSATRVVYYNQMDGRWADSPYGTDNIGSYGCGPSSMAIVVSSLTGQTMDPPAMARWSVDNGYWASGQDSYHSIVPGAAKAFGLSCESISPDKPQDLVNALASGKLIVALMGKGHFTKGGHFIVLRGVTEGGKILVADPGSKSRSGQEWDISIILSEVKRGADAGGPLWADFQREWVRPKIVMTNLREDAV